MRKFEGDIEKTKSHLKQKSVTCFTGFDITDDPMAQASKSLCSDSQSESWVSPFEKQWVTQPQQSNWEEDWSWKIEKEQGK